MLFGERKKFKWLCLIAVLLLFPALFINLGLMTVIDDEGIRSLVALEMKFSGNWITPTWHGEFYYKKPPLFNWILLIFFTIFNSAEEWIARLPTVLAMLGYGATIFYFLRRHFSDRLAFINALVTITCGRILFWDSFLGLIDITFSWFMFTLFMVVFHRFSKKQWWALFLITYFLTSLGFLLKGLPALVFQAITLLVYFSYRKSFHKLISIQHFAGILLLLLIVGSYYFAYNQYNPNLPELFKTLFFESSKRTAVDAGIWKTIGHLFTFPVEMTYHFLPWSLLTIFLFRKKLVSTILEHPFVVFSALVFFSNVLIYWISPKIFPRYLLMLAPLFYCVLIYLYEKERENKTWRVKFFHLSMLIIFGFFALGSAAPLVIERTADTPYRISKSIALMVATALIILSFLRNRRELIIHLVLMLLLFRIGFNWFILPDRNKNDFGDLCRQSTIAVADLVGNDSLFIYADTEMQATNTYYLNRELNRITERKYENFSDNSYYIIDPHRYLDLEYQIVSEFQVRHGQKNYHIGKFVISQ